MHLKKWEEKLQNLEGILTKVNNSKNILLIEIMKLTRKLKFNISNALLNINLINAIKEKYTIKNKLINDSENNNKTIQKLRNIFKKRSVLWIYLTENQKYSTDSYSRYEKKLLTNVNPKHDDFITIGQRASEFCNQNKFDVIKSFSEEEKQATNLAWRVSQLVKTLYIDNNYSKVNFVLNTNKNYNGHFTVLPIDEFNINKLVNEVDKQNSVGDISGYKIYPGIEDFVENEINIILENAIYSLLIESFFYNAKNDLVTTNKIINQIEEDIAKVKKKIIRTKREKEIEEIVLLTKANEGFGGIK
ncbi:MSC_0622 family F1-like ATPase gamma subunit [Mycoplasma sp. 125]|uniref:MSC_0622 family F1-like ATPase gamma subunit n=1 Tax=Mycoplasma sp. 125 TaxID=3447505 RepID=UPI003F65E902